MATLLRSRITPDAAPTQTTQAAVRCPDCLTPLQPPPPLGRTVYEAVFRSYPLEHLWVCRPCRRLYLGTPRGEVWAWVTYRDNAPERA